MTLNSCAVRASIAVSDIAQAKEFYEDTLDLPVAGVGVDGSQMYACGGDTSLHVYPSPANAGRAPATLATWDVTNLEQVVDDLTSRGVTFEHYDPPLETDDRGIYRNGDIKVAWSWRDRKEGRING